MSDVSTTNETVVPADQIETVKPEQQQQEQIDIDMQTAFSLKLQEFDKKITEAELTVADLKKQRATYIYDENVKQIVMAHKERLVKAQVEEETKKKLAEKTA
jgi:hypothetical protein